MSKQFRAKLLRICFYLSAILNIVSIFTIFRFDLLYHPYKASAASVLREDPCDSPHSLREQIECAEKDLRPGTLAFEPKRNMDQGQSETVSIRISPDKSAEVGKGFKHGPPALQEIRVGPLMKAKLYGPSEDFIITPIGEEKKIIKAPYTEWTWRVTPLTGGDKKMEVSVYAELMLPNGDHEPYEAFTGSANIFVHVNPLYVVRKFVQENWQWLLGSPILLGLIGWLWARVRKEKKRNAGFRPE